MLDQKVITTPNHPLTSYNKQQQWPLHFQTQEDQILTVPPAQKATDRGSLCREPSTNPELQSFLLLDSPCHLSIEKEKAADTCHKG